MASTETKNGAKACFNAGNYGQAASLFAEAIKRTENKPHSDPGELCGLLLNHSACMLKMRKHIEVVQDCRRVLDLSPTNERAYSRSIKSLLALTSFEPALHLAQLWMENCPQSAEAKAEFDKLKTICETLMSKDDEDDEEGLCDEQPPAGTMRGPDIPIPLDQRLKITEDVSITQDKEENSSRSPTNGRMENRQVNVEGSERNPKVEDSSIHDGSSSRGSATSERGGRADHLSSPVSDDDSLDCSFCSKRFHSKSDLSLHCSTTFHKQRIMSYDERTWKYRLAPSGQSSTDFTLCGSIKLPGQGCPFGANCVQAHSEDELVEWKERFSYLQRRLQQAEKLSLHGHLLSDQIQFKLSSGIPKEDLLKSHMEGVSFCSKEDTEVLLSTKTSSYTWTFTAACRDHLQAVVMLDNDTRDNFKIESVTTGPKKSQKILPVTDCNEWENPRTKSERTSNEVVYRVKVKFQAEIYGTFKQTVIFSYHERDLSKKDLESYLMKELIVTVRPTEASDMSEELIFSESQRWESLDKVEIVKLTKGSSLSPADESDVLEKYARPDVKSLTGEAQTLSSDLTADNYVHKYHTLLYYEEMEQYRMISKFCVKTKVEFVSKFLLCPSNNATMQFAAPGELFGRLPLGEMLSEDSVAGRILLMNVNGILLTTNQKKTPDKVYEALILDKGKGFLMIKVPALMVAEQKIKVNGSVTCQAQFIVNRFLFCEMHAALDRLTDVGILFPQPSDSVKIPWDPSKQWIPSEKIASLQLNAKQREGLIAISASHDCPLPPIVLSGPFGTGKTMTLAKTVMNLIENRFNRVLICTHSNSAADLYIEDYLDAFISKREEKVGMVRVYYKHRWISTVKEEVRKYCLFDTTGQSFRSPTLEDLTQCQVVIVTLSTCYSLLCLDLPKDFFTHILIDEAAQAKESEIILPLVLAGRQTKVALAGDHMQMNPDVCSSLCQAHGLQNSLMDRLFRLYDDDHPCKILLCENYRSHPAIVDYASELFYDGLLIASGKQQAHPGIYPLTFHTARGEDILHQNSTGYYNSPEVFETVDFILKLRNTWPKDLWGEFRESSIGVVTPYLDQVTRLRYELRKKKLGGVCVERVFNVQGKQFRVIVINTVRTYRTCTSQEKNSDYGFLSNPKLLNTAITRAQSLVAVIGDPMSICSVGKCRAIWLKFVETCHKNESLHGVKWDQLRRYLDYVVIKAAYKLNPLATEFVPKSINPTVKVKAVPVPGQPPRQHIFGPTAAQFHLPRPMNQAHQPATAFPQQFALHPQMAYGGMANPNYGTITGMPTGYSVKHPTEGAPIMRHPSSPKLAHLNNQPTSNLASPTPDKSASPASQLLDPAIIAAVPPLVSGRLPPSVVPTPMGPMTQPPMVLPMNPYIYGQPMATPQQVMLTNQMIVSQMYQQQQQIAANQMAAQMMTNQYLVAMLQANRGRPVSPLTFVPVSTPAGSTAAVPSPLVQSESKFSNDILKHGDAHMEKIDRVRSRPSDSPSAFRPPEAFIRKNSFDTKVASNSDPALDPPWLRGKDKSADQSKKVDKSTPQTPPKSLHTPLYMRGSPSSSPGLPSLRSSMEHQEPSDSKISYSQALRRQPIGSVTPAKTNPSIDMTAGREFFNLEDNAELSSLDGKDNLSYGDFLSMETSTEFMPGLLPCPNPDSPLVQSQGSLGFSSHFPTREQWQFNASSQESGVENSKASEPLPEDPLDVLKNLPVQSSHRFQILTKGFGQGQQF